MRAIRITEYGGPEVLKVEEVPDPVRADGFDLIEVTGAGVNYADTHQTDNTYLSATELPTTPGSEVVGVTQDGRRVAALVGTGGYAEKALGFPGMEFALPEAVSDGQALALMVQGLSAYHLLKTSTHLAAGESVVVHAAAGGVGTLAVQLAKLWGAGRVIGVASSEDKRKFVESLGADATVDATTDDMKSAILEANDGKPVDIVLEMTGGPTFDGSLAALAPLGRIAIFGMASRTPPAPIDPGALLQKSRAVIGFWLVHFMSKPGMVQEPMAEMLDLVAAGKLSPVVGGTYALADARKAHEDLRSRQTTGKLLLDPRL